MNFDAEELRHVGPNGRASAVAGDAGGRRRDAVRSRRRRLRRRLAVRRRRRGVADGRRLRTRGSQRRVGAASLVARPLRHQPAASLHPRRRRHRAGVLAQLSVGVGNGPRFLPNCINLSFSELELVLFG